MQAASRPWSVAGAEDERMEKGKEEVIGVAAGDAANVVVDESSKVNGRWYWSSVRRRASWRKESMRMHIDRKRSGR